MDTLDRIFTPFPGGKRPDRSFTVPAIDTGAAFRPDWRMQDPAQDPKEPYGSESSSAGNDHGWSNCTMVAAALAYAYQVQDKSGPQGGDMRHHQDDLSGGTDLYDARTAWSRYGGQTLDIRSGAGWSAVKAAHNEGRAIVIQGEGNVPGTEAFDGGHACCIGPETNSSGLWLWGDPLATGWQWVSESSIRDWAERLTSGIAFGVSRVASQSGSVDMAINTAGIDLASGYLIEATRDTPIRTEPNGEEIATARAGYKYPYIGTVVDTGFRAALINTDIIYDDDGVRPTVLYLSASDTTTYPDPDAGGGDSDPLAAKQEQWDADAASLLGPRPA